MPIKNFREKSVGVSRDCPIFWVSPIISGTGKATDFKFCRNIYGVNRNKKTMKNVGNSSRGRSQGVPKLQGTQGASRGHLCDSTAFLYIHGHTTAFTWCDCRWPWRYFKVIRLFHIKFLVNGALYGKSYNRVLIGNHTLALDWCHFWWPWSTFQDHFSLGCHFCVHFSNLWHAFASRGLPAIAELLVTVSATHIALTLHSFVNLEVFKT